MWRRRADDEGESSKVTRRNRIRADAQSLGFAVDLCHVLQEELTSDRTLRLSLLDVGARTAAGSNLLAQVFHPASYSRIKLRVTALDIDDTHRAEARRRYPDVRYRVGDVRSVRRKYDVVTCSHTLEHLTDPGPALEHMRRIARRTVVIAAPHGETLGEGRPNRSGHRSSFDEAFFSRHSPERLVVYRSPHWSESDCFVAVYGPS